MVVQWRHRHRNHLEDMIIPLTQMYGHKSIDQTTRVVEWLDKAWAFEVGFLQIPQSNDPETYFPHSFPICYPTSTLINDHHPKETNQTIEHRAGHIPSGDPLTFNMDLLRREDDYTELNLAQLYCHIRDKADTCSLHNMYDIILFVLYHDILLHKFPSIRHPCEAFHAIP